MATDHNLNHQKLRALCAQLCNALPEINALNLESPGSPYFDQLVSACAQVLLGSSKGTGAMIEALRDPSRVDLFLFEMNCVELPHPLREHIIAKPKAAPAPTKPSGKKARKAAQQL